MAAKNTTPANGDVVDRKPTVHKPTLKWVDAIIARKRANGVAEAELAKQRKALARKHGITIPRAA